MKPGNLFLPYWHGTGYFLLLKKVFILVPLRNCLATDTDQVPKSSHKGNKMAEHYTTLSFANVFSSSQIPSPTSKYRFNMEYSTNKSLTITNLMK
jgi:hypothetical protein